MIRFGILTAAEYARMDQRRRFSGARAAYRLLDVGPNPSEEQIRIFEDISVTLRTSNGTFRTTFRNRFADVDAESLEWIGRTYPSGRIRVQDRAVSHGLTSAEWAARLFAVFPGVEIEASDLLLELVELSLDSGESFIVEPGGAPLQYIRPPFAVAMNYPEARRYPINRWIAARGKKLWTRLALPAGWMDSPGGKGYRLRTIPYIHPQARALAAQNPRLRFCIRSVFDRTPGACEVLRTLNILNLQYFSRKQL